MQPWSSRRGEKWTRMAAGMMTIRGGRNQTTDLAEISRLLAHMAPTILHTSTAPIVCRRARHLRIDVPVAHLVILNLAAEDAAAPRMTEGGNTSSRLA